VDNPLKVPIPTAADRPPSGRRRRPRWIFITAALSLGMVLGVGLVEILLRLNDDGRTLLVKDRVLGQRYRAGASDQPFVPEAGRAVALRFNQEGFRGPDHPLETPSGVRRIAVLGDSFIAGVAVDELDTFTARLEARLNLARDADRAAPPPPKNQAVMTPETSPTGASDDGTAEVMNFGVSGWGTGQALLAWREVVSRYRPELVIVSFFNGNDLADNSPALSTANRPTFDLDDAGALFLRPMSAARSEGSRWLAEHSRLYVWQRDRMRMIRDRWRQGAGALPPGFEIFRRTPTDEATRAWKVTEAILAALRDDVRRAGSRLVVLQVPTAEQVHPELARELLGRLNERDRGDLDLARPEATLADCCERLGLERIELRGLMVTAGTTRRLFFGAGHWTEAGQDVAARAVAERLRPRWNERPTGNLAGRPVPTLSAN
jgi:hypothetical protein